MQPPDWTTLRHAYGTAGDIPALLDRARVAPPPRDYRDEPWFTLWSSLCHQGDVYTASYAAVPELIAIAEQRRSEARTSYACLYMAAIIELERAAPESSEPPPLPRELALAYSNALKLGATLTTQARVPDSDADMRAMLEICRAVFDGEFTRARVLTDGLGEGGSAETPRAP